MLAERSLQNPLPRLALGRFRSHLVRKDHATPFLGGLKQNSQCSLLLMPFECPPRLT